MIPILVTGPQRAGTTITAKILADMLGREFVDEHAFGSIDVEQFCEIAFDGDPTEPAVIQCPAMFGPIMRNPRADVLVVLVRRDLDEIHASERRIGWDVNHEAGERHRLGGITGCTADFKYDWWDAGPRPPLHMEIVYGSLAGHPLWLEAADRVGFAPKQTAVAA